MPFAGADDTTMRAARVRTVSRGVDARRANAQLHALGAGRFIHVTGSLERHLHGTQQLLRGWGGRDALCRAGLYHAVYGTDGIIGRLVGLEARRTIAEVIGEEAERLVYLYGACDRERFHPRIGTPLQLGFVDRFAASEYAIAQAHLRDFCELTVANELDLALGSPRFRLRHGVELSRLFARMGPLLSDAARTAVCEVLA